MSSSHQGLDDDKAARQALARITADNLASQVPHNSVDGAIFHITTAIKVFDGTSKTRITMQLR
jgi:hypothetical protein